MMKRTLFALGAPLLLALFLLTSSQAFAASSQVNIPLNNFSASCTNIRVTSDGVLHATCKTRAGQPSVTELDLRPHVGNNNGTLFANGNNFNLSCQNIGGARVLTAKCFTRNHVLINTQLDLNPNVNNNDGVLQWQF